MSCPNANAPIDISMSAVKGKCDLKCSYSFNYNNSSCVATNRGDYISISYDKSSSPPVLYNASGYDVNEIRLYIPSLHSYNNSKTDGELIIVHTSNTGTIPLLVCIPIKSNNSSSISSMFFKTLIDTMSSSAPSDGETTSINVPKFNLSLFVPKKSFFSYTATEPYQPCSSNVDLVVFAPLQASLDINSDTLKQMEKIVKSNPYDMKKGPNLFYNEKGSKNIGSNNGEIYIDCQPVGQSEDTIDVIENVGFSSGNFDDWLKNPIIKFIIMALIFIFILFGIKYALTYVTPMKGSVYSKMTK